MRKLNFILLVFVLAGSANAAIIYSGSKNILIPTTLVGVYIDIDRGGTVPEEGSGWDVNFIFNGEGIGNSQSFQTVATTIALDAPTLNLTIGQAVGSSSTFSTPYPSGYSSSSTHIGNNPGQFVSSGEGFIGFKFTTNSSSGPHYGWLRVELSNTDATGLVKDWAYENTVNSSIIVGAIPEPSGLFLLSIGTAGAILRRRRL